MSEGSNDERFPTSSYSNKMVIVLFGKNSKYNQILKKILSNESLTENSTSPERGTCDLQVSVIDASDNSPGLRNQETDCLSPDCLVLFALVLVAQDGQLLADSRYTFDKAVHEAKFGEHAFKNMILAIFSTRDLEKPSQEAGTSFRKMIDQSRYFTFNEESKGTDLVEKLRALGQCMSHREALHCSVEQTKEELPQEKQNLTERESKAEAPAPLEEPPIKEPDPKGQQEQNVKANATPIMTIVLLGQSGSGKSSSGNTILGKPVFKSSVSSVAVTTQCQTEEAEIFGIPVRVIDTPDFFSEDLEKCDEAIKICRELCSIGHLVYLLVMQLGRFTDGEREILPQMQNVFGQDVLKKTIILFTYKDDLGKTSLKEYIENTDERLQDVIKCCGSRCHAFDNTNDSSKQVSALFKIILGMQEQYLDVPKVYPGYKYRSEKKDCVVL